MADLQEVTNPVNNTGSNPPENSFEGNPGEIQTNPFAEQSETLNQPQEVTPVQPTETATQEVTTIPVPGPDLSSIEPSIISENTGSSDNHPVATETASQSTDNSTDSQAAINAAKKEKLAQLIKAEQKKGEKNGFTKGILSGVAITVCIFAVSVIFAKDQIVNLLSDSNTTPTNLEANVVDLNNEDENINDEEDDYENEDVYNEDIISEDEDVTNEEDIDDENINIDEDNDEEYNYENEENTSEEESAPDEENNEILKEYYLQIDDIFESDIDNKDKLDVLEQLYEEILSRNFENKDLIKYIDQRIMDINDKIYQENTSGEDDTNNESYTINHVDSEEDANWVLPAHCDDLTCYGEDKEFTPCTSFKQDKNLNETARRIGNNGVCKYKDTSELIYVEFN